MIADELKHQFDIALDKKKIYLEQPIRALGEHEVELHLHPEVKSTLKVRVESTTPIAAPAAASDASAADAKPKTEKRGKRTDGEKVEAAEAKPKAEKAVKGKAKSKE